MTDWSEIVNEHKDMVWRTVSRLLGHDADAADCFQETFLAALQTARRESVRNWSALLRTIATHRALDRLRQRVRQRDGHEPVENWDLVSGDKLSPSQGMEMSELARELRQGLAELPEDQARAFCLRFLEELSYRQIADQMGISTSAVGVLLHRARTGLKRHLGPALVDRKD